MDLHTLAPFLLLVLGVTAPPDSLPDIETFMQIGAAATPSITRDGATLFFTMASTGTKQLYRLTKEGWPYQLTFFADGIGSYNLSPDERTVAVTVAPGGNERYQIEMVDALTGLSHGITRRPDARYGIPLFAPDSRRIYYGANADTAAWFYVYEQDLRTGQVRTVLRKDGWNTPVDVSEDGRRLLVSHATESGDNDLYDVEIESGRARLLTPHQGKIQFSAAFYSKDPGRVYAISDGNPDGVPRLTEIDGDPPRRTDLLPDDRSPWAIESLAISPDYSTLAWIVNEDGWGRLRLWDTTRRLFLPSPQQDGIAADPSLSATGRVAFVYNSPLQTADIWTWDGAAPEDERLKQRTFSSYAGIDPSWFTPPELVHYESFDGTKIPAFLYLPRGTGQGPIPFIIDVHGGPEGQFRPYFNRHFQYLLLHGYGLLAPNVRGSTGYGRAYMDADNYKKRLDAVADVAWGAKYLIARGLTRPDRLGIKGASYGGYMTLAAMIRYPELFAAGEDEVGIADFETFLANTAAYRREFRASEYGPPEDVAFLRSISPIHEIDRLRGALMVVHGRNDPRVPVGEARQILHALAGRGVPVDSLIFPDEGHGVNKLSNRLTLYRRMVDFFDRTLKNGERR